MKYANKHFWVELSLRKKMICLFLSTLLAIVSMTSFVFAGSGLYITSNGYVSQSPYSNLCWAATSVSMLQTKSINTDVKTYATRALGGTFSDTIMARSTVAQSFYNVYGINATLTGTFGFSTVQSYMASNKPIYAGINWNSGGGHAVAISGTDSSVGNSLRIMDPYYGWEYPDYNFFLTNYLSSGYWSQSIYFN